MDNKHYNINFDWSWPSVALIVIALVAGGYNCSGCMKFEKAGPAVWETSK